MTSPIPKVSRELYLRGLAMVLLAPVCWSSTGVLVRLISANSWTTVFWRAVFQVLTIGLVLVWIYRGKLPGILARMGWPEFASAILIGCASFFWIPALNNTTIANALVFQGTAPILASVLAWAMLGERITKHGAWAMTVALAGMVIMFAGDFGSGHLVGDLLALLVAIAVGANVVALRYSAHTQRDMLPAACLSGVVSALLAVIPGWPLLASNTDMLIFFVLGTTQVGLGAILFTRGARYVSATEAGLATLMETILGALWVWLIIHEAPSPNALVGGTIVVLALAANAIIGARHSARIERSEALAG